MWKKLIKRISLIWQILKGRIASIWQVLRGHLPALARILVVAALVALCWWGFLWLVGHPAVGETSALVMVWVSIALLLAAVFPRILRSVKRVKFKGFEVELASEIERATGAPPLTVSTDGAPLFGRKGGADELIVLLRRAASDRSRPVLLDVDIGDGRRISVMALHLYAFVLTLAPNPVAVVFRTGRGRQRRVQGNIRGVIDGARLAQLLRREFPEVWRSLQSLFETGWLQALVEGRLVGENVGRSWFWERGAEDRDYRLTLDLFEESILPELCDSWITVGADGVPAAKVARVLQMPRAEWLLLLGSHGVTGLVDLCRLARRLAVEASREHLRPNKGFQD